MRILAHEMPDGSVQRSTCFEPILAWLMAGRTEADVVAFIASQVAGGASEQEVVRLVAMMHDPEREAQNRGNTAIGRKWAYALRDGNISEAEALNLIATISCPEAVRSIEILENPVTPEIAHMRSSLYFDGDELKWNMVKARDIARAKLREARAPLLSALDVEYMRADELGNRAEKNRIASVKQKLRNITISQELDSATTPHELLEAHRLIMLAVG